VLQARPRIGFPLVRWTPCRLVTFLFVAGGAAFACDDKDPPRGTAPVGSDVNPGSNNNGSYALKTSLTLDAEALFPGDVTEVRVQLEPPGSHTVLIALVDGDELAFISDSVLMTDSAGRARTKLTVARTGVGTVTLQALVDGAAPVYLTTEIVAPSEATLNVVPVYSGDRPFDQWHIAVLDSPTCPMDYSTYVDQEAETFTRPAKGQALALSAAPTGRPVSILVRAEEYAFGCTPGVVVTNDMSQVVQVNITDEPLVTADLEFPLRFGVYSDSEPFWSDLSAYLVTTVAQAFRGDHSADSVALLDKMQQLAGSPEAFESNREAQNWDALLEVRLTAAGASQGLTSRVQRWLLDGARLLQSHTALVGNVTATENSAAAIEIQSLATLAPQDVGVVEQEVAGTLNTSGTDDVVRLAFKLEFEPSRLFGALAAEVVARPMNIVACARRAQPAAGAGDAGVHAGSDASAPFTSDDTMTMDAALFDPELPDGGTFDGAPGLDASDAGPLDPPSALAAIVGCSAVGSWLSEGTGQAYEGCDASCAESLCEAAIVHLWQQVLDADRNTKTWQVSAAGRAELDRRAHVVGLTGGEWIGTTDLFQVEATDPKGTMQGCTESAP
jgi:hypothetical protein